MPYKDPETQKAYQRNWVAERRALWFRDKVCAVCGTKNDLELDHIDPSIKWKHSIWSYSWAKIAVETAKCQVLCHYHHWEKTKKDMQYKPLEEQHGTYNGYQHYGCRCDACRAANTQNKREYREKRRKGLWSPLYAGNGDYEPEPA